jgi:hypothetical protein
VLYQLNYSRYIEAKHISALFSRCFGEDSPQGGPGVLAKKS